MGRYYADIEAINDKIKELGNARTKYSDAIKIMKNYRLSTMDEWPGYAGDEVVCRFTDLIDFLEKRLENIDKSIWALEKKRDDMQDEDNKIAELIAKTVSGLISERK